jgi:hypothetical protein
MSRLIPPHPIDCPSRTVHVDQKEPPDHLFLNKIRDHELQLELVKLNNSIPQIMLENSFGTVVDGLTMVIRDLLATKRQAITTALE